MIAIVDHGQGDFGALERAFRDIGADAVIAKSADLIERASHLVVAGTGSFPSMIRSLRDRRLVSPLVRAITDGRNYLGIGLGMQLLLDVSYEQGQHTGLGIVPGKAIPFGTDHAHPVRRFYKPPHQGWAGVHWGGHCPLLNGLKSGESFYFEHGAHAQPLDVSVTFASASYGTDFAAVLWNGRMYGTQFLPELSQEAGRKLLANFARA